MFEKKLVFYGFGLSSVFGGGGTGLYFLLQDNTIVKQLIKENKKILDISATSSRWLVKLNSYTSKRRIEHDLELPTNDIVELRNWCKKTLNSKYSGGDNYESAKALCTVPTIGEKLLGKQKQLSQEELKQKVTGYNNSNNNQKISGLSNSSVTEADIENWCKNVLESEYLEENTNYNLALKWCTKEGK